MLPFVERTFITLFVREEEVMLVVLVLEAWFWLGSWAETMNCSFRTSCADICR